jgi:uncharacterized protein YqcC (DUF446 family)
MITLFPWWKAARVRAQADKIEAEMKRIGFWSDDPPDLQAAVRSGKIISYADAPSFELWLQCIFLPNAREAARTRRFPSESQVGYIAWRQWDYQSSVPEAEPLMKLLDQFDAIIDPLSPIKRLWPF